MQERQGSSLGEAVFVLLVVASLVGVLLLGHYLTISDQVAQATTQSNYAAKEALYIVATASSVDAKANRGHYPGADIISRRLQKEEPEFAYKAVIDSSAIRGRIAGGYWQTDTLGWQVYHPLLVGISTGSTAHRLTLYCRSNGRLFRLSVHPRETAARTIASIAVVSCPVLCRGLR